MRWHATAACRSVTNARLALAPLTAACAVTVAHRTSAKSTRQVHPRHAVCTTVAACVSISAVVWRRSNVSFLSAFTATAFDGFRSGAISEFRVRTDFPGVLASTLRLVSALSDFAFSIAVWRSVWSANLAAANSCAADSLAVSSSKFRADTSAARFTASSTRQENLFRAKAPRQSAWHEITSHKKSRYSSRARQPLTCRCTVIAAVWRRLFDASWHLFFSASARLLAIARLAAR
mmetsp:Transcript_11431/g.42355  ORF Transcript_11431/g.42355 Transcript_11431/m.42355 type:complete len:234 (+) Transcript_11431:2899-3600(+)